MEWGETFDRMSDNHWESISLSFSRVLAQICPNLTCPTSHPIVIQTNHALYESRDTSEQKHMENMKMRIDHIATMGEERERKMQAVDHLRLDKCEQSKTM